MAESGRALLVPLSANFRFLLSMVLAVAVGFLLEVALVDGIHLDGEWRNYLLLLLGVAAGFWLAGLWFRDLNSAANAGVFLHVALEDRSERPMAEDALLRWWVADTWEHATVMPMVGEVRQSTGQRAHEVKRRPSSRRGWIRRRVRSFAVREVKESPETDARNAFDWDDIEAASARLASQIAHSRVLAPGARSVSLLVHGRPELIAPLGGLVARKWNDDRSLRLVVDNTSMDRDPFLVFDTPSLGSGVQLPHSAVSDRNDDSWSALLVLKRRDVTGSQLTTQEPKITGPMADADEFTDAAAEWHVRFTYPLAERPEVYEKVVMTQAAALEAIKAGESPGRALPAARVGIQGEAPVSLAFAAGFHAGRLGLAVGLMRFLGGKDGTRQSQGQSLYSQPTWPRKRGALPTVASTKPSSVLNRGYWNFLVVLRALGLGFALPIFAGAVALSLEWGVAGSQPELNAGDWSWLIGLLALTAIVLLAGGAFVRRRLIAPGVTIALAGQDAGQEQKQNFAHRRLCVDSSVDDTAEDLAVRITAAFTDVLTVLPQVRDVAVDLGGHPMAWEAIHNFNFGLRSSLRGNAPVSLRWRDVGQSGQPEARTCNSGPGRCDH